MIMQCGIVNVVFHTYLTCSGLSLVVLQDKTVTEDTTEAPLAPVRNACGVVHCVVFIAKF